MLINDRKARHTKKGLCFNYNKNSYIINKCAEKKEFRSYYLRKRYFKKKYDNSSLFSFSSFRISIIRKTNKTLKSFYNNLFIYYN